MRVSHPYACVRLRAHVCLFTMEKIFVRELWLWTLIYLPPFSFFFFSFHESSKSYIRVRSNKGNVCVCGARAFNMSKYWIATKKKCKNDCFLFKVKRIIYIERSWKNVMKNISDEGEGIRLFVKIKLYERKHKTVLSE